MNEKVVEIAKSWIGTPWHYGAAVKGRGVDCAKFVFCVYREAGIIQSSDLPPHLPAGWHSQRPMKFDPEFFCVQILKYGDEVPFNDRTPGDLISFRFRDVESHVAILIENDEIIHAVYDRCVQRDRLRLYQHAVKAVYREKQYVNAE